jgi:hypothetical protein
MSSANWIATGSGTSASVICRVPLPIFSRRISSRGVGDGVVAAAVRMSGTVGSTAVSEDETVGEERSDTMERRVSSFEQTPARGSVIRTRDAPCKPSTSGGRGRYGYMATISSAWRDESTVVFFKKKLRHRTTYPGQKFFCFFHGANIL